MKERPMFVYPKQAQELLGVGTTKFYEWAKLPSFPVPKKALGRRPVYVVEELEYWAKNLA